MNKELHYSFKKLNPESFLRALNSKEPVHGLTHNFYRYPARFSPSFTREVIKSFTEPGDLIFDPFIGGGTTLVEAINLKRHAIGVDISSLATFIARVKTTILSDKDILVIKRWADALNNDSLNLRNEINRPLNWIFDGYQRNINTKDTWRIRKVLELALKSVDVLSEIRLKEFARCALLKTAQWALDCRNEIPSVSEFRKKLIYNIDEMICGIIGLRKNINSDFGMKGNQLSLCLCRSAVGIEMEKRISAFGSPKLVLTSPPYPGVHILYHRWQIQSRRETPAPFWIANCLDGNKASFYSLGDRKEKELKKYFKQLLLSFTSVSKILDKDSIVVQLVSFSDPSWQLEHYLKIMEEAGLRELSILDSFKINEGRLWRDVPNRKWYAHSKGSIARTAEVVLFHRLA